MKKDRITKYGSIGALTLAIMLSSCTNDKKVENSVNYEDSALYVSDMSFNAPNGYHFEGETKLVRNPNGLVNALFIPEEGYHLEPYEYDNSLFYVVMDGYHNENGFLIPDGYHLENDKIIKDMRLSKTR